MLRQRLRTASSILALVVALSLGSSLGAPATAADGTIAPAEMNGFGRLILSLNKSVKAQVRSSSGVIVLTFEEPVSVELEKLAAQMPSYVSIARRDPDGRTVRFATTRPLKANLMEAGEKLFLDLLPESWQGLPPALPQDIVEQLARRARDAEDQLRKTQRDREKRELRDMTARVGNGPTFTRLIFDIGQTVPVDINRDGDQLTLKFDAALPASARTSARCISTVWVSTLSNATQWLSSHVFQRCLRSDATRPAHQPPASHAYTVGRSLGTTESARS